MKRICVAVAALALLASRCDDDPESHVYVAALYDADDDCFGMSTSLGYVQTPDGDLDCAPTCLASTAMTGNGAQATQVYVSTMCGPYPSDFDTSQTNPMCAAALAAWPAEQAALAGSTYSCASPASPGSEDDAGEDGGSADAGGADDATGPG